MKYGAIARWLITRFSFPAGLAVPAAALFLTLATTATAVGQEVDTGTFVFVVEADTFAIERFVRRPGMAEAEMVGPSIGRIRYEVSITADESVGTMHLEFWTPGAALGDPPNQAATLSFDRDTAVVAIIAPPGIGAQHFASAEGAFLYLNPSFLLIEQMVRRARADGREIVSFPAFLAQDGETVEVRILDAASETVGIVIGNRIDATVDRSGRLLFATLPDQGLTIVRTAGP